MRCGKKMRTETKTKKKKTHFINNIHFFRFTFIYIVYLFWLWLWLLYCYFVYLLINNKWKFLLIALNRKTNILFWLNVISFFIFFFAFVNHSIHENMILSIWNSMFMPFIFNNIKERWRQLKVSICKSKLTIG